MKKNSSWKMAPCQPVGQVLRGKKPNDVTRWSRSILPCTIFMPTMYDVTTPLITELYDIRMSNFFSTYKLPCKMEWNQESKYFFLTNNAMESNELFIMD